MTHRCKYCGKEIDEDLWSEKQAMNLEENGYWCPNAPRTGDDWPEHKIETKLDRLTKFYEHARKKTTSR
jgi:hypothetical protein